MYKELLAMVYLAKCLNQLEVAHEFEQDAVVLKVAVQKNCWDERDGFFYSVDLNLMPISEVPRRILGLDMVIHSGFPRSYDGLIQRIGSWSGFLAMWSGIASQEQAQRMVIEHYKNEKTFNAPYGVRTLSKLEKMYSVRASGNPSNWLGPIWGISNYLVYKGLVNMVSEMRLLNSPIKPFNCLGRIFRSMEPYTNIMSQILENRCSTQNAFHST